MLTPTLSTTGLASQTEPPLQSAPSVSHLVRALVAKTDWVPIVLLGSRLGIRSDKPVSRRSHSLPPLPEIVFPPARADERRTEFHRRTDKPQDLFPFHSLSFCHINLCQRLVELLIPLQIDLA